MTGVFVTVMCVLVMGLSPLTVQNTSNYCVIGSCHINALLVMSG